MGSSVRLTTAGQVIIAAVLPAPTAEYSYCPQTHLGLALASDKVLVSLAVGWTGRQTLTWNDLRPIYGRRLVKPSAFAKIVVNSGGLHSVE